jgi:hypothetical protein
LARGQAGLGKGEIVPDDAFAQSGLASGQL